MKHQGETWRAVFLKCGMATLSVVGMAYGTVLLVGYGWGILGARLRRFGATQFLAAPFSLVACIPAFWLVTMVVVITVFRWDRPGFADELTIPGGFDFLSVWHSAVVAFPIASGLMAWQLRAVSNEISTQAAEPYVRALFIRGHGGETIFYGNIFKHSLKGLIQLFDKSLPPLLGALIPVEWAYHYRGLGTFLVEAVREARYEGIFLTGLCLFSFLVLVTLFREIAEGAVRVQDQ